MAVSDVDDLEKFAASMKADRDKRGLAALRRGSIKTVQAAANDVLRRSRYYHSGPNQPSLPKLKFMEGKDD